MKKSHDSASKLVIPFAPTSILRRGSRVSRQSNGQIDAVGREKLLNAIRRASAWVEAVRSGEAESFEEIAVQEGLGERHVRWLTPLAFLYPKILAAALDGSITADLTVATLARALPHSWALQELFKLNRLAPHVAPRSNAAFTMSGTKSPLAVPLPARLPRRKGFVPATTGLNPRPRLSAPTCGWQA